MARVIEPKLRSWYWWKLDANSIALSNATNAIVTKNPTALLVAVSSVSDNFRELTGKNDGMRVELAQMTVNGRAEFEAWCMAEVQSKVAFVEEELEIKSEIYPTEHCMTLWRDAVKRGYFVTIAELQPGDIAIWNKVGTDNGHTGIVVKIVVKGRTMLVAEGNTTQGLVNGQIVREGGGGYIVERPMAQVGNLKLMGGVRPFKKG